VPGSRSEAVAVHAALGAEAEMAMHIATADIDGNSSCVCVATYSELLFEMEYLNVGSVTISDGVMIHPK
jgi:hypothetical protein